MTGVYCVRNFGRRTLHLVGHTLMALCHFIIAFTIAMKEGSAEIVFVCVFIFVYMNTAGPAGWAFASETCSDTGLALAVLTYYFWETFSSFSTEALMDNYPSYTFVMYGCISIFAVVFVWIFMGETKGLSEKEKKEIFMPGAIYGRKLRPGEEPIAELGNEHKSRTTLRSEMLSIRNSHQLEQEEH